MPTVLQRQGIAVLRRYLAHMRQKPDQGKAATSLMKDPRWIMVEDESKRLEGVLSTGASLSDAASVRNAYRRWAPIYDFTFVIRDLTKFSCH